MALQKNQMMYGAVDSSVDGLNEGSTDGNNDGCANGKAVGLTLGNINSNAGGSDKGILLGIDDSDVVGLVLSRGSDDGANDELTDGLLVQILYAIS